MTRRAELRRQWAEENHQNELNHRPPIDWANWSAKNEAGDGEQQEKQDRMTAPRKLGRLKPASDHRDLAMAPYLASIPTPPASVVYSEAVKRWGELGNDTAGDCTEAGLGHFIQTVTANAQGKEASITTSVIMKRYERLSGYVPGDESTDTGLDERTVLKDWLRNPIGSHKLTAFGALKVPHGQTDVTNMLHLRQAHWVLGGLYLGLELPTTAEEQFEAHQPWDVVGRGADSSPGSWGGHCTYAVDATPDGLTVVTWGKLQLMSWNFVSAYCDLAWGLVLPDFLKKGVSPTGFDLSQLEADLAALRSTA